MPRAKNNDAQPDASRPSVEQLENELRLTRTTLGQAMHDLEGAAERLMELERRQTEYLAMLSHELRNPLAPIRNSLFILDHAAPGSALARRAQAVIYRQVDHLSRIIEDLLDVTRVTSGRIQLHPEHFDLNDLARSTVEDHRSIFAERGIHLRTSLAPAPVRVLADRTRLGQAVANLLENAAKFTERGGTTTVSVHAHVRDAQATLHVKDNGRGIAPGLVPHVFELFKQADTSLDRSLGGLGLGLALVKGLVEMHGGSVRAESAGLDKGATFTICLPLDTAVAEAVADQGDAAAGTLGRVLVIEDNPDAADSLREALELSEHVVEVARDGQEGIEKARVFEPEVVVCDIGLPELDGYEVARMMRADPALRGTPLVALSGYSGPEDVRRAEQAGFDFHLAKPPSIDTLERALLEAARKRREHKSAAPASAHLG